MKDLKQKTIRGGLARLVAQGANFLFRIGSLMIMARLLDPAAFGLVGMVTAFTGVLELFRDFGLSTASVQREDVTDAQLSTLFWINVGVGILLTTLMLAFAPLMVRLYHEPRLLQITIVLASGFLLNAAGVQHSALLQRQLRFTALAVINVASLTIATLVAVAVALLGYGYWALVAMTLTLPVVTTVGAWSVAGWIPGLPTRGAQVRSMLRFGGVLTLNGLVVYVAYNTEKILLGRFWGPEAVGLYGRAYQLINVPTANLNSSIGEVAFAALSRVQSDLPRLRSYFLKGYSVVLGMTIPATVMCALFARDLIVVLLGPKWISVVPIFRLLAPTILVFAIINPLSWLLFALGMVERSLKIALVLAPLVIGGYLAGLKYGPTGVAIGYSAMLTLWLIPHIAWCVSGTPVSIGDIVGTVVRPLISGLIAGGVAFSAYLYCAPITSSLYRVIICGVILAGVYVLVLLFGLQQKALYRDLFREFRNRESSPEAQELAPA